MSSSSSSSTTVSKKSLFDKFLEFGGVIRHVIYKVARRMGFAVSEVDDIVQEFYLRRWKYSAHLPYEFKVSLATIKKMAYHAVWSYRQSMQRQKRGGGHLRWRSFDAIQASQTSMRNMRDAKYIGQQLLASYRPPEEGVYTKELLNMVEEIPRFKLKEAIYGLVKDEGSPALYPSQMWDRVKHHEAALKARATKGKPFMKHRAIVTKFDARKRPKRAYTFNRANSRWANHFAKKAAATGGGPKCS